MVATRAQLLKLETQKMYFIFLIKGLPLLIDLIGRKRLNSILFLSN